MNQEELKSLFKANKVLILLIVLASVVLVGGSYAWYSLSFNSTKNQVITAGSLSLNLEEGSNTIGLTNTVPQSDTDGMKNTEYTFKVSNNGTLSSKYYIYLDDKNLTSGTSRMNDDNIRYNLVKNGNSNGVLSLSSLTNNNGSRLISEGTIDPNEEVSYSLKIWIKEEATTAISGQEFISKLRIEGAQLKGEANEPDLVGDMIPVVYDSTNSTWKKASYTDTDSWYNYDNQIWANAVTIKDQSKRSEYKEASTGTAISMSDINTMFVWIPRYSYTLGNTYGYQIDGASTPSKSTPGAFNIKFVSKTVKEDGIGKYTGNTAMEYYTPSSFCWGDTCDTSRSDAANTELSGIWVSKFETTGTVDDITSIPNVKTLRTAVAEYFSSIQNQMNGTNGTTKYGFNGNYDTHMMKNTEWGAVAYLSQSKYGKYGNNNYKGVNKEIFINNSSDNYTGRSGGVYTNNNMQNTVIEQFPNSGDTTNNRYYNYGYFSYDDYKVVYGSSILSKEKEEGAGTGASTTGNIYGIYDMGGGASEYVMGNMLVNDNSTPEVGNINWSSGFIGKVWSDETTYVDGNGTIAYPSKRYVNHYNYSSSLFNIQNPIQGDATIETHSWYDDTGGYPHNNYPWIMRGSRYTGSNKAGIFHVGTESGRSFNYFSSRIVIKS